jgi:hypothetical protein
VAIINQERFKIAQELDTYRKHLEEMSFQGRLNWNLPEKCRNSQQS